MYIDMYQTCDDIIEMNKSFSLDKLALKKDIFDTLIQCDMARG